MIVIGRRSAASVDGDGGAGLVGFATGSVPSRLAIAFSRRLRCPRVRPSFSRSASVRSPSTSASMSFWRNSASYCARPRLRSQAPTSMIPIPCSGGNNRRGQEACPEAGRQATSRRFDPLATSLGNDRYFSTAAVHSVVFARQQPPCATPDKVRGNPLADEGRGRVVRRLTPTACSQMRQLEERGGIFGGISTRPFPPGIIHDLEISGRPLFAREGLAATSVSLGNRANLYAASEAKRVVLSFPLTLIFENRRPLGGRRDCLLPFDADAMEGCHASLEVFLGGRSHAAVYHRCWTSSPAGEFQLIGNVEDVRPSSARESLPAATNSDCVSRPSGDSSHMSRAIDQTGYVEKPLSTILDVVVNRGPNVLSST